MNIYDRERTLKSRLNVFLHERFVLPDDDYYSRLDRAALGELKSLLSDINNIFTLKVCLEFGNWLGEALDLSETARLELRDSILRNPPNANGYDIEIAEPTGVVAEVKCNVPINGSSIYGSAQRDGILKDVNSLMVGKSKSRMRPDRCLKFLVFLDVPQIRRANQQLVKNMKQYRDAVVFVEPGTKPERKDKLYIVHVGGA